MPIKWKSRLVANGSTEFQDEGTVNAAYTVSRSSVNTILGIASFEKSFIEAVDIKGAYLNAILPEESSQLMAIRGSMARLLVSVSPEYGKYMTKDVIYVKIKKALYGLKESARLFLATTGPLPYFNMLEAGIVQPSSADILKKANSSK